MTSGAILELAGSFWERAGFVVPYPRDLEDPVAFALPLGIARLPRLWVRDAERFLAQRLDIPIHLCDRDRPLHGCMIAAAGGGWVLLDGAAPAAERRFTIAHEVAHYLYDYERPREQAMARIGQPILEVLDGLRPPTMAERAAAALAGAPLGTHIHLMERGAGGIIGCASTLGAETHADQLALELLAPEGAVLRHMHAAGLPSTHDGRVKLAEALLMRAFGLPPVIAAGYAPHLCRSAFGGSSFREWLAG